VGLVQRELEAAGIATVSLSMIPELTRATGAPRVAGIPYPLSRPLGAVGDADGQRAVLRATLALLAEASEPGTVRYLPFLWPESDRVARKHRGPLPPIAKLIMKKPWLFFRFVSGEIPD
jgi:D-proline reductase (dithiol) PrdB